MSQREGYKVHGGFANIVIKTIMPGKKKEESRKQEQQLLKL